MVESFSCLRSCRFRHRRVKPHGDSRTPAHSPPSNAPARPRHALTRPTAPKIADATPGACLPAMGPLAAGSKVGSNRPR
jgi:hypothetical protein